MKNSIALKTAAIGVMFLLVGCAAGFQSSRGVGEDEALEEAAQASAQGVTLSVLPQGWNGVYDINQAVTPMRVRIDNGSANSIRLRADDFSLFDARNHRFPALPPSRIKGRLPDRAGDRMTAAPGSAYEGFTVSREYASFYSDPNPYLEDFASDPFYTGSHGMEIELPTEEMLQQALAEGVVQPGESVEGWLYFAKVPQNTRETVMRAHLVNADSGRTFGDIRVPLASE